MASSQKWLREVQALIDQEGWPMEIEPQSRWGKHAIVLVRARDGRTKRAAVPLTPSDHRSFKNVRSYLRRTLRELEDRVQPSQ